MASLYDISMGSFKVALDNTLVIMQQGLDFYTQQGKDPDALTSAALVPDMFDLSFQIRGIEHHSLNGIKGILAGEFHVPRPMEPKSYTEWMQFIQQARAELDTYSEAEINALEGKEVVFVYQEHRIPFTAENFVLSFNLPNLYFHITTLYDLLRIEGAPLGKRLYLGAMRVGYPAAPAI